MSPITFQPQRNFSEYSISSMDYCESLEPGSLPERPQIEIRTTRRRFHLVGLLSTLFVIFLTGGLGSLILGWVCVFHDCVESGGSVLAAIRNGTFAILEPSGLSRYDELVWAGENGETLRILLFSALASHLVSVTGTILVTLLAYRAAAQWLQASESPDDDNITPIQYGLLVRTLGSGSIMSIINTFRYTSRIKRAKAPRFFKEAIVGVTGLYLLGHAVGLIDLVMHNNAQSAVTVRFVPTTTNDLYGLAFSDQLCGPLDKSKPPCQNLVQPWAGGLYWAFFNQRLHLQAYDTLSNLNPYISLEYIDGTAFLVPGPTKKSTSHGLTITTQGLRIECANLADQCDTNPAPVTDHPLPGGKPVTNCAKAGYPGIPYYTSGELEASGMDTRDINTLIMGVIGDEVGGMINGTADFSSLGWTSNPAQTIVQMRWPNTTARASSDTPGVAYTNALDLYATCSLTYLDVVTQYDPQQASWTILNTTLSPSEIASVLWSPQLFLQGPDYLLHALKPYVTSRGSDAMRVLAESFAKLNMAYAAPLMNFDGAASMTNLEVVTLGLYPAAPTLLLIICLYAYAVIAVVVFLLSSCGSNRRVIFVPRELTHDQKEDKEKSALDVAQTWLTDPLPLVGSMFPGGDGRRVQRSVESDPLRQVYDSDWELGKVGIGLHKAGGGEMIFGMMRQAPTRSKRYGRVFDVVEGESVFQEKVPIRGSVAIGPSLALIAEEPQDLDTLAYTTYGQYVAETSINTDQQERRTPIAVVRVTTSFPPMPEAPNHTEIERLADAAAAQTFGVGFNDLIPFILQKSENREGKGLIEALDMLIRRLFEHRNRLLRLELLPDEVLLDIFRMAIDFDKFIDIKTNVDLGVKMPTHYTLLSRLQMVQKRWHDIIVSFAPFWSLQSTIMPDHVLEMASARSQKAHLIVHVRNEGRLGSFTETTLPASSRIDTLIVDLNRGGSGAVAALWISCPNVQNLHLVDVDHSVFTDLEENTPSAARIPSPRWIHFNSSFIPSVPTLYSRVEELVIERSRITTTPGILKLIVESAPSLQTLRFDSIGAAELGQLELADPEPPVIAPNLKLLEITWGDGFQISWILNRFQLSPFTSLKLKTWPGVVVGHSEEQIRSRIRAMLQSMTDRSFCLEITPWSYRVQTRDSSLDIELWGDTTYGGWPDFFKDFVPRAGQAPIRVYTFLKCSSGIGAALPNENSIAGLQNSNFVMM
ncbi:hypothetical protein FRB90_001496 [Tulasnella sp. 427]|nr:hypothetical protein FRB90_001496 [Tulasnella sp. 427]